jgi:hypothetical protein
MKVTFTVRIPTRLADQEAAEPAFAAAAACAIV